MIMNVLGFMRSHTCTEACAVAVSAASAREHAAMQYSAGAYVCLAAWCVAACLYAWAMWLGRKEAWGKDA